MERLIIPLKNDMDEVYQCNDYTVFWNGIKIIIAPEEFFFNRVRVKKHRKRRIDKKWEKRYGYKTVPSKRQCYYAEPVHSVVCSRSFYDEYLKKYVVV